MIHAHLMDGSLIELTRDDAVELMPYLNVFSNPALRHPVEGLIYHRGKIIPVLGPLPRRDTLDKSIDERPWLLLMKGYAQVVRGLPVFPETTAAAADPAPTPESAGEENPVLSELDQLLKSA